MASCKEAFTPKALSTDLKILVIDGFINATPNSITTITLSRTKKLNDTTTTSIPELFASIQIEGEDGSVIYLSGQDQGKYISDPLTIDPGKKYRLNISTTDGANYVSDYVVVKMAPAIDSVTWSQDNDVKIAVSSSDPSNNTRYYLYNYVETWEYHSAFDSRLGYENGAVTYLADDEHKTICYKTKNSQSIITASSAALSEDVISKQPVTTILNGELKLNIRYSILMQQIALTAQGYQFWELMKKNSEQLGGLFDPLPSQLFSNYKCTTDPNTIVIGYLSASSVQEKRIFIDNKELKDWVITDGGILCEIQFISPEDADYFFRNGAYLPVYFITGGGIAMSQTVCVDCTLQGGTLTKPSFW